MADTVPMPKAAHRPNEQKMKSYPCVGPVAHDDDVQNNAHTKASASENGITQHWQPRLLPYSGSASHEFCRRPGVENGERVCPVTDTMAMLTETHTAKPHHTQGSLLVFRLVHWQD